MRESNLNSLLREMTGAQPPRRQGQSPWNPFNGRLSHHPRSRRLLRWLHRSRQHPLASLRNSRVPASGLIPKFPIRGSRFLHKTE